MRITYVVHQFFPRHYTGTERVALNLAKQMQRMGHHVRVLTYGPSDEPQEMQGDIAGVGWREYSFEGVPVLAVRHWRRPQGFGSSPSGDHSLRIALDRLLPRWEADVVHVVHPLTLSDAAFVAAERGIPVVVTLTDFWLMCPLIHQLMPNGERCFGPGEGERCANGLCLSTSATDYVRDRALAAREFLGAAARLVAPSQFVISMFKANGYADADFQLIRHGVDYRVVADLDKRYDKGSPVTFGFIGTILKTKGVLELAEAWSGMQRDNVRLRVYGPFSEADPYQRQVRSVFERGEHVELLGKYEYDDVARILSDVDVVVIPSTMFETSSLVMALAQAHRIPVITQNVGAPGELVKDRVNGVLVSPGDVEGLRRAMEDIAEDPTVLNEMRRRAAMPPRIEEEAFEYEQLFWGLKR